MDNLDMVDQIVRRHPFDKAYFLPLEHLFAWAGRTFGRCNIVNGQSSDSIYCWGASGRTIGCFLQRLLVNDLLLAQPRVLRGMAVRAIEAVYRHRWKLPRTLKVPYRSNDYWAGLLDPQGYLPVIHIDSEHHEYRRYLAAVVEKLVRGLDNDSEALRMYLKMMYLQGPTNVPLVAAARAHGHNLVMPFVDARLVNLRRERQDDRRNLFRPRYVLEEFMRSKLGFDPAIIHQASREAPTASSDATFGDAVRAVYDRWDQCCRELF